MSEQFGLRCVSILTFSELVAALQCDPENLAHVTTDQLGAMRTYRQQYGIES